MPAAWRKGSKLGRNVKDWAVRAPCACLLPLAVVEHSLTSWLSHVSKASCMLRILLIPSPA
eukprot:670436-Pelagomonas_calceolata.AAC.2